MCETTSSPFVFQRVFSRGHSCCDATFSTGFLNSSPLPNAVKASLAFSGTCSHLAAHGKLKAPELEEMASRPLAVDAAWL